jgi:Tfp pilus assembly protein FimT
MTSPRADRRSANRAAFSLLELILVLVILVTLAGFAIPTFESMISSRRLKASVDRLQNELLEARVEAMRTGQAQVFRASLHSGSYSLSAWLGGNEDSDASAGATVMTAGGVVETERTDTGAVAASTPDASESTKTLEKNVMFFEIQTLVDARNALEIQKSGELVPLAGASAATTGGLSSPLLLYPDGSATTAQIILADERGRRMAIQVRGVTGRSTSLKLSAIDPASLPTMVETASTGGTP